MLFIYNNPNIKDFGVEVYRGAFVSRKSDFKPDG